MSDFFDDENDYEVSETRKSEKQNLVYVLIFAGVALVIFLIILALSQEKIKNPSTQTRKDPYKKEFYRKRKPGGTTTTRTPSRPQDSREQTITTPPRRQPSTGSGKQPHLSVVRVFTENTSGSATLISSKGYFLTNEHVVGTSPYQGILFSKDPKAPPKEYFLTQTVFKSKQLDLAVLKISRTLRNASLNDLVPAKIGSSSALKIGEELIIYGYPGIGGKTITLTRGVISGFLQEQSPWIKTDATISGGNSGGGAFNRKGEFIGVPTGGSVDANLRSQIGLVRPIDAIKKYISPYL